MIFNRSFNDIVPLVLQHLRGSNQDRKMKWLSVNYPEYTGSITDREMSVLAHHGFSRGSFSDRWKDYIVSLGGIGIESWGAVMENTFYGVGRPYDGLLLVEGGDYLLMENGDRIELEGVIPDLTLLS